MIPYHMYGTFGQARGPSGWTAGRIRPHAPHTWPGFSTGVWEGNSSTWTRRYQGRMDSAQRRPHSDRATMTEHFIRHDDQLTMSHRRRSGVSRGAVHPDVKLGIDLPGTRGSAARPIDIRTSSVARTRKATCRIICPAPIRCFKSSPRNTMCRPSRPWAAQETTPGVHGGAETGRARGRPPRRAARRRLAVSRRRATFGGLEVLPVQGSVHMIAGAGGNIAVQIGEDGVLLVDRGGGEAER